MSNAPRRSIRIAITKPSRKQSNHDHVRNSSHEYVDGQSNNSEDNEN